MAIVYVGSARGDENGRAYGGKAGDQTGREVSTQVWYKHSKGWRVLRAKNPLIGKYIAEAMRSACNNNKIGYDQHQNQSLWNAVKNLDYDPSKVTVNTETDCARLIRVCVQYACKKAGIDITIPDFYTATLVNKLLSTGLFIELKGSKYTDKSDYLGAGDILCTLVKGHVVAVLNNGDKYEDKTTETTTITKNTLGNRILKNGMSGDDVKELQSMLISLGYDLGSYGVNKDGIDGDYGSKTIDAVKDFQNKYRLEVDGEYGSKTHAKLMEVIKVGSSFVIRVVGDTVNVRNVPNTTTGEIQYRVKKDAKLNAVDTDATSGWYKLEDGNYISNRYTVKV